MRVLVTGAYGFVGNAVVRRLAEVGHEVVALTHRPAEAPLPELPVSQVVRGDIRDKTALAAALDGVEGVCHLAALTRVRESFDRPEEYQDVNAGGTVALLDALAAASRSLIPRVILGSTAAVYGAPERQPISEDTVPAPSNPYGVSKLAADDALRVRAEAGEIEAVSLRCFNISGAVSGVGDADESRIIPKAVAVAAGRYPHLEMNGDGDAVRDFVHVDDLARAYVLALEATSAPYRLYNVGATAASMREIVATVERVTGKPVPVVHRPPQPEPPRLVADISRITTDLGWKPERSSLEALVTDAWSAVSGGDR
ncbi:NAD-dependent epimerase/dehydratase family protein [Streptomyces sp. NRRL F-2580]|uniref:NAD-dependent epimerase/dehydratase family protein n=1 Tax=Streptomyces sp. NRRL F-2580 TaxID=1463841 RepID=UPI0005655198|nr:NAD-dependent epimerase/dehydratase family protein [Streptomyces sp. NRRL F-2580]